MAKPFPKMIYHYTSLETLQSIIQNKTIRLSDITKSNDSKEIALIGKYIQDVFMAAYEADKTKLFKKLVPEEEWERQVIERIEKWFTPDYNGYSYYACCFSTKEDLLSQWRGYADDGRGVAIGFNSIAISELISGCPAIELKKVVYTAKKQRGQVRKQADLLIKQIKRHASEIQIGDIKNNGVLDKLYDESFQDLFRLAIGMKSSFFEEENEIRLCYMVDNAKVVKSRPIRDGFEVIDGTLHMDLIKYAERINDYAVLFPFKYVVKNGGISSYVDLGFQIDNKKAGTPLIREVWLGPKCGASEHEIQRMFRQQGMEEVVVTRSKGTYR